MPESVGPGYRYSWEDAEKIAREYYSGATTTELAAKYQTSKSQISRLIRKVGGELRSYETYTRAQYRSAAPRPHFCCNQGLLEWIRQ